MIAWPVMRDVVGAGGRGAPEGAGAELTLLVAVEVTPMCSRCRSSSRALLGHDLDRVLVGQVSEPLTVSKAWLSQLSSFAARR